MKEDLVLMDGNEAAAYIAHKCNEVCAIYPITPSSSMGELADQWSTETRKNIFGTVPDIMEMQSEGGASGALHGALQTGALATTFTASQGLLLMIPNMYKIAGELTCCVMHVTARSLAAQALSIFGDHSDIMAVRSTGWAMLGAASVQEAHDMALIAQAATLKARIPFIHFFDGFRTSHEVGKIAKITDDVIEKMIDIDLVIAHRKRGLNPENPVVRGTAQNPDVYFQGRETVNPYYDKVPGIVEETMNRFAELTGRAYKLFDYYGAEDADRVMVIMGSGAEAVKETIDYLNAKGEKLGMVEVRLFRPFSTAHLLAALPASTKSIAVLDRTKEPGALGEPLYQDIVTALAMSLGAADYPLDGMPAVIGGRYGLSSKEFTPSMVKAVYDELKEAAPKNSFTVGIVDDVGHTSLSFDPDFSVEGDDVVRAIFYGLGSDGTVGANKNTIKIIGEETDFFTQAYFVYDSKKSGSKTASHLRFGPEPIRSTYVISSASFVACHQFNFIEKMDVLEPAAEGATFLLNAPYGPDEIWDHLPGVMQKQLIDKKLKFYVIDADKVALETGMGRRTNTIMQTCFFAISGILPKEEAIEKIKGAIKKTFGKKGEEIVKKNWNAVDGTLENLNEVTVPASVTSDKSLEDVVSDLAPDFVKDVTAMMMDGKGDLLPVSKMPVDGTFPTGTTKWEKRNISHFVPVWEPGTCIQCGNCAAVCPHSCIRMKHYDQDALKEAPESFKSMDLRGRGFPGRKYTLQVYVEDCTGCTLCTDACPAKSLEDSSVKAINMKPKDPVLLEERANAEFFETIEQNQREHVDFSTIRGVQYLEPLFEFCGACAGCGETPYIKMTTQLFGDRMIIANATGCSSIYGGNLPTTPYTKNQAGRGPAWSNSLFEDNAEFGLGFRLTADKHRSEAVELLTTLKDAVGAELVEAILNATQRSEGEILAQRERVETLKEKLQGVNGNQAGQVKQLLSLADHFVRRSIWIFGGDGWAYDIGYGGLDHVLASGRNVNVLVMDTEVYSNTGGQASKATPLGAVAKFASAGKSVGKKDLAMMAIAYGNVYVARIALGANPQQSLLAMREAEAFPGPSLILAYSHCIAHGINMEHGLRQQKLAVECGHWPLMRYNPELVSLGENPLEMDSGRATISVKDYAYNEIRYKMLALANPERAEMLMGMAQDDVKRRYEAYEQLAIQEQKRIEES